MKKKSFVIIVVLLGIFLASIGLTCTAETRSDGLKVVPLNETVYAQYSQKYEKDMWRYSLLIYPTKDVTVTLKKYIRRVHHPEKKEYFISKEFGEEWLEENAFRKVSFSKPRRWNGGTSTEDSNLFFDITFIGVDENGNQVKGSARIHFMQARREHDVGPFE